MTALRFKFPFRFGKKQLILCKGPCDREMWHQPRGAEYPDNRGRVFYWQCEECMSTVNHDDLVKEGIAK